MRMLRCIFSIWLISHLMMPAAQVSGFLLPIWMAAYKYNGKSYRFLVNGQTGEVQGERPWSIWKIAFAVIIVAAIALAVLYLSDPQATDMPLPDWLD